MIWHTHYGILCLVSNVLEMDAATATYRSHHMDYRIDYWGVVETFTFFDKLEMYTNNILRALTNVAMVDIRKEYQA